LPDQQWRAGRLYQQVKEILQVEIDAGRLQVNDRVSSERELSDRYGMSRMTVRHALTELVNEGVLYRQQGKGTFVARPKIRQKLMGLTSFTEDMASRGMVPGARVLTVQLVTAPYTARQALGLPEDAKVVRVERLRLADGAPMALEVVHLPEQFSEVMHQSLEDTSLYALLEQRFGVRVLSATQSIEPAQADAGLARILKTREGALLLLLERITFDERGQPVEFVSSHYRADRYRFIVELQRR
jgi:GntR family transcriptional regulator